MTPTNLDVVLYLYDSFAMYTADVAAHFGMTQDKAWKTLKGLEAKGLIVGFDNEDDPRRHAVGKRVRVGKNLMWQCCRTYDDHKLEEVTTWATEVLAALPERFFLIRGPKAPSRTMRHCGSPTPKELAEWNWKARPTKHVREALRREFLELSRRVTSYPELRTTIDALRAKRASLAMGRQ